MAELTERQLADIKARAEAMTPGQSRADLLALLGALATLQAEYDKLQDDYNQLHDER